MGKRLTTVGMALMMAASLLVPNVVWQAAGAAAANDIATASVISFGRTGDQTVSGRWRSTDRTDGIGTFLDGVWYLRSDLSQGSAENVFSYGRPGDTAVTGDWNGDGADGVGTFLGGNWYLRNHVDEGSADVVVSYGNPGDQVVTGDWDGDGKDGIGTFLNGTWYLRNSLTSGPADIVIPYGNPGDQVVTGDWDGDGKDGIGTFLNGTWYLRNALSPGPADRVVSYGNAGDRPMASDWDGVRGDGIGTFFAGSWYLSQAQAQGLLHSLDVAPYSLLPGFLSQAHDYGIRCTGSVNTVNVTAVGEPGSTITINGRASPQSWAGPVTLAPDQALVVNVNSNSKTEQYWVRCLPPGFPLLEVQRPGAPAAGYYLLENGVLPGASYWVVMLDTFGAPVWYKQTDTRRIDLKAMPGGLIGMLSNGYAASNEFEFRNLSGARVGGVKYVDQDANTDGVTDSHDALLLKNGNYLVMAYTDRTVPGAAAIYGTRCGDGNTVYDFTMQEITPAGVPVWTWNSYAHFAVQEVTNASCWNAMPVVDNGNDIVHANSLEQLDNGDILVSSRHMNAVFRVERQTGRVAWKIGGVRGDLNPDHPTLFRIVNDPLNGTCMQHDARILANGNLQVFDNHSCGGGYARAVEYQLNATTGTATLVRQYPSRPTYTSPFVGSARRQPDGATVISWGGRSNPQATEVAADGTELIRLSLVDGDYTYRTVKVPDSTWTIDELRANAGGRLSQTAIDKTAPQAPGNIP